MKEFKDISSYGQKDKNKIPHHYTYCGAMPFAIHRHIYFPKDSWVLTCSTLDIDLLLLNATDIEEAKREAFNYICDKLTDKILEYKEIHAKLMKE